MVDDSIVTPTALWQLHEDVLHLFCGMAELYKRFQNYPIDYGSPEFNRFLLTHSFQEYPTKYHGTAICKAKAQEALEHIPGIAEYADSILRHRKLFVWFAAAYVDWPSDRGLVGSDVASRHDEAFAAANSYLRELLADEKVAALLSRHPDDPNEWDEILNAARKRGGTHDVAFLYAKEIPVGLKHEAALAIKYCEPPARRPVLIKSISKVTSGGKTETLFIPTDFQNEILKALDGCALKKEALAVKVCEDNASKLYKGRKDHKGPLPELIDLDLVAKSASGYYRPDAPPSTAILRVQEVGTKTHPK